MKSAFALALTVALAGCAASQGTVEPTTKSFEPVTLTKAQIEAVKEGAKKGLKDPNSAMFGDQFFASREVGKPGITVCGYVNAKNSFGGYTGQKPFMGILSEKPLLFAPAGYGGGGADNYAVGKVCQDAGIKLPY